MRPIFSGQRVNYLGPATLVAGKLKIAGKALMCGTLYVEIGAATTVAAASTQPGFRPSDIRGAFTPGEAAALAGIQAGEAELVWRNNGKESTLPISVAAPRADRVTFVARKP